MRFQLVLIFLFVVSSTFGQSPVKKFFHLSCPEKWWVITHPFIANKARKITADVIRTTSEMKTDTVLDGNSNGGQVDAFRHAFWMASLSQKIKMRKALSLGRAHEKGNYKMFRKGKVDEENFLPDSISGAMDLFNNEAGAIIGCQNACVDTDSLKNLVRAEILAGKMRIISINENGNFLDCNGNILDLSMYLHEWNIPKCLVPSHTRSKK